MSHRKQNAYTVARHVRELTAHTKTTDFTSKSQDHALETIVAWLSERRTLEALDVWIDSQRVIEEYRCRADYTNQHDWSEAQERCLRCSATDCREPCDVGEGIVVPS